MTLRNAVARPLHRALHRALPGRWRLPQAFDAGWYARHYPDAATARGGVWLHWLRHGRHEGRLPCAIAAAEAEAALWAGDGTALATLDRLSRADQPPERLWARLALARVAAATSDWGGAARWLDPLDPVADLEHHLGLPGPLLLWAEICWHLGQRQHAERLLRQTARAFGQGAALRLARAGLALSAPGGTPAAWRRPLAPLYRSAGLAIPVPESAVGDSAFDRLTAAPGPAIPDGPLVSVILPSRNAGAMLDTALSGLVAQSWRQLEILVVDNGSQDDTAARLARWQARDPRIRVIDGAAAQGAYGARNLGLQQAAGAMIALHDADDWSHPDRIARQMQMLRSTPDAPACLSFWARMTEALLPTGLRPDVGIVHPNLSSLLMRRAVVDRIGYWDQVRSAADSEYLARIARVYGATAIRPVLPGVPLAFGRVWHGSLTRAAETGLFTQSGAAARTAYLAAAAAWHAADPAPYLPAGPGPRPFAVPPQLEPAPAPARAGEAKA